MIEMMVSYIYLYDYNDPHYRCRNNRYILIVNVSIVDDIYYIYL